jgi:hemerythrin-like domain-containing protein
MKWIRYKLKKAIAYRFEKEHDDERLRIYKFNKKYEVTLNGEVISEFAKLSQAKYYCENYLND